MARVSGENGGIGFEGLLSVMLIGLKLTGSIDWGFSFLLLVLFMIFLSWVLLKC